MAIVNGTEHITQGDFNGDGKLDIAVSNYNANVLEVFLGNGDGTFTPTSQTLTTGAHPNVIAVADFNGDGKPDLAVANGDSNTVLVFLGNGDGTFTATGQTLTTGDLPFSVVTGDFNGDGKPDLVSTNFGINTVTVMLGNGDGTFTTAQSPGAGVAPDPIAVADLFNRRRHPRPRCGQRPRQYGLCFVDQVDQCQDRDSQWCFASRHGHALCQSELQRRSGLYRGEHRQHTPDGRVGANDFRTDREPHQQRVRPAGHSDCGNLTPKRRASPQSPPAPSPSIVAATQILARGPSRTVSPVSTPPARCPQAQTVSPPPTPGTRTSRPALSSTLPFTVRLAYATNGAGRARRNHKPHPNRDADLHCIGNAFFHRCVPTKGAPNLDFNFVSGGTCATGTPYTVGQTCTVNYHLSLQRIRAPATAVSR